MVTTTTTLPLRAAASHLGMSTDTLRKRLQRGLTPGRKVDGAWVVDVLDSPGQVQDHQESPGPVPDVSGPTPSALAVQRAEEMAVYSERLLAPYVRRIEEQAEEIGHLKAELEQERSIRQRTNDDAPPPESQAERRSWWQRLWGLG